jgi:hypothetical protein
MLSERRKADRKKMMAALEELLNRLGVTYRRTEDELKGMCPHRLSVELDMPRGLQLTVEFDGESPQPDVHVLSWHVSSQSGACLSEVFPNVNNFHFQKATDITYGLDHLLSLLELRIESVQDGTAFSIEREDDYRRRYEAGLLPWQQIRKAQEHEGGPLLP